MGWAVGNTHKVQHSWLRCCGYTWEDYSTYLKLDIDSKVLICLISEFFPGVCGPQRPLEASTVFITFCTYLIQNKPALHCTLQNFWIRNKMFLLDEMTQWNASKFAIFFTYTKTQSWFFHFSFHATLCFFLMNAQVYANIDQGIH